MSNPADKITAELMALAERFAYHSALIDETHIETRDALEQAIRRAVDCGEPVAKIKPSQKSMRELLSEVALGDSQPAAKLTELCRGLEIPAPTAASCTPAMLYEIGRAIAAQAKEASPQRAEPASVQALPPLVRVLAEWEDKNGALAGILLEEWTALWHAVAMAAIEQSPRQLRAALAAHPSDQNHSG